MENDRLTLNVLLSILSRYSLVTGIIFISCILLASLIYIFTPNTYEARTLIQVETSQQGNATGFEEILSMDGNESNLDQQEQIYKSRMVLGQVIENLELDIDIEKLQKKIDRLANNSRRFYSVQNGGLLEFSITGNDGVLAKKILDEINYIYMKQNIDKYALEARNSISFLDNSIDTIKIDLTLSSEKLNTFKEDSIPYDISLETQNKLNRLIKIEEEISKINIREKEISQTYKINHPVYLTLLEQKELLTASKNKLESEISNLPSTELEYISLARDVEVSQNTLETMLNRRLELSVIEASTTGNIRVIDKAYLLKNPISPNLVTLLGFAIILWFVISFIYIFIREYFLKKILSPTDLEKFEKDVVGVIPNAGTSDLSDEAFSTLMANITISDFKQKKILISGPTQGVGKSFVTFNLAKKLEKMGKKVLILDLDLRRGSQASNFDMKISGGISDTQNFRPSKVSDSIDLLTRVRGKKIQNIFSILNSRNLRDFIEEQAAVYDHILIDTAPILPVSDTKLLLDIPDQILIVLRQNQSTEKEFGFSLDNLNSVSSKISGIVLNDFKSNVSYYGYDYYSYRYNSNYKDNYNED